jgi:UDP-N-acetyl-D-mannosaminuronic acid transferase (WecB/TagA/CpsF family)
MTENRKRERHMGLEWLWRPLSEPRRLGIGSAIALCWLPILLASDRISARRDAR